MVRQLEEQKLSSARAPWYLYVPIGHFRHFRPLVSSHPFAFITREARGRQ